MKLKKCHITNFGTLKNQDYDFNGGLNEFFLGNGEGKTTLAAFLRAVLYGMDDVKPKSKNNPRPFCERTRYYPFDGGEYGGSLEIEANGKSWRIERRFDEKKGVNDDIKLFCDAAEMPLPKTSAGEYILGIDKASFGRTLFIDRSDLEITASESISAKLNDIVEDTDSGIDLKTALQKTEELLRRIKSGTGTTNKPKIRLLNERANTLDSEIKNAEDIAENLKKMYADRNRLADEISELQKRADAAAKAEVMRENRRTYDSYIKEAAEKDRLASDLKNNYPNGIPAEDELKTLERCAAKDIEMNTELKNAQPTDEDKTELARLEKIFENGMPDSAFFADIRQRVQQLKTLEDKINTSKEYTPTRAEAEILHHFENGAPTDADIENVQVFADNFRSLRKKYESERNAVPEAPKANSRVLPLAIAAVILTIVGIAVLAAVNKAAGAVLLALGILLGIAAVALDFSDRLRRLENSRENAALNLIENELADCAQKIAAFNAKYGYITENDAVYDFDRLKSDIIEYDDICARIEADKSERDKRNAEFVELNGNLSEEFAEFGIEAADKTQAYEELSDNAKEFAALKKDMETSTVLIAELTAKKAENDRIKDGIIQKYTLDTQDGISACVTLARKTAAAIDSAQNDAKEIRKKAEVFKTEKQLADLPEAEGEDVSAVQKALKDKLAEIANLDSDINEAEPDAAAIPDLKAQRAECEEKKAEYEEMFALYKKVGEYFTLAEKNLKSRYIDPVKNSYITYAAALEEALGEKIEMDKEYHIMFEKGGAYRSEKHLSAGQLCMCALCFRLALTDNMYKDEKPFIIMDDPFADLDREHMKKAAKLVEKLAADRQIIYFCCHESRQIM